MAYVGERKNCKMDGCNNLARNAGTTPSGKRRWGLYCSSCYKRRLNAKSYYCKRSIDNSKCSRCGWDKAPCDRHRLKPELGYVKDNVIPLCPNCHRVETFEQRKKMYEKYIH